MLNFIDKYFPFSKTKPNFEVPKKIDLQFINELEEFQKRGVVRIILILGVIFFLVFALISYFREEYIIFIGDIIAVGLAVAFLYILSKTKKLFFLTNLVNATLFLFLEIFVFIGGESGELLLWALVYPICSIYMQGLHTGLYLAILFLVMTELNMHVAGVSGGYQYAQGELFRFGGTYVLILFFVISYEITKNRMNYYLLEFGRRLSKTVKLLEFGQRQQRRILDHVRDGLFLIGKNLKLEKNYSKAMADIFDTRENLEGMSILDLLKGRVFGAQLVRAENYLREAFENDFSDVTYLHKFSLQANPLERVDFKTNNEQLGTKVLKFVFSPVFDNKRNKKIMVRVSDKTESEDLQNKLEEEKLKNASDAEILFETIEADPNHVKSFCEMLHLKLDALERCRKELMAIGSSVLSQKPKNNQSPLVTTNELDEELKIDGHKKNKNSEKLVRAEFFKRINLAMAILHAIKGHANIAALFAVSEGVHEAEIKLKSILENSKKSVIFEELINQINSASTKINEISELLNHFSQMVNKLKTFQKQYKFAKSGVDFCWMINRTVESFNETSGNKEIKVLVNLKRLSPNHMKLIVDREYQNLVEILLQLVKNTMAHGFSNYVVPNNQKHKITLFSKLYGSELVFPDLTYKELLNKDDELFAIEVERLDRRDALQEIDKPSSLDFGKKKIVMTDSYDSTGQMNQNNIMHVNHATNGGVSGLVGKQPSTLMIATGEEMLHSHDKANWPKDKAFFSQTFANSNRVNEESFDNRGRDRMLSINYHDNGRGIWDGNIPIDQTQRKEELKRIFDPHYSTKSKVDLHSGQGIGLSMVKGSIENVGGKVIVSDLPVGFGIRLFFPILNNSLPFSDRV